jgi:voltage-gated potassium channel
MSIDTDTKLAPRSNAYEMFIFVLTVLSLAIMVLLLLPLPQPTLQLLGVYDNLICVIFLLDFGMRLATTRPRSDYFLRERGWLDLLGSIPNLGLSRYGGLLRLARLSRLARISRLMRGKERRELTADLLAHRSQYAGFITLLAAMVVLVAASVLVLTFESRSAEASITTGGEAMWWSVVTISTVGYGDYSPVTMGGRITAVFVMFAGVGIIGSLASILASVLVSPSDSGQTQTPAASEPSEELVGELRPVREELARLRERGEAPQDAES